MTITELKKLKLRIWDGTMKRRIVQEKHLGLLQLKEIVVTFGITRWEYRKWEKWEYYHRITKHKNIVEMSEITDTAKLQARIKELEGKLQEEQLKTEALTILIKIGEEKYGLDLRKKNGAKPWKR